MAPSCTVEHAGELERRRQSRWMSTTGTLSADAERQRPAGARPAGARAQRKAAPFDQRALVLRAPRSAHAGARAEGSPRRCRDRSVLRRGVPGVAGGSACSRCRDRRLDGAVEELVGVPGIAGPARRLAMYTARRGPGYWPGPNILAQRGDGAGERPRPRRRARRCRSRARARRSSRPRAAPRSAYWFSSRRRRAVARAQVATGWNLWPASSELVDVLRDELDAFARLHEEDGGGAFRT